MQVSKTIGRVIWRRTLDDRSFEECDVTATPDGFAIAGHVIAAQDGAPLVVHYDIDCGENWSARSVAIDQSFRNDYLPRHLAAYFGRPFVRGMRRHGDAGWLRYLRSCDRRAG